jgi:hypothetical protein
VTCLVLVATMADEWQTSSGDMHTDVGCGSRVNGHVFWLTGISERPATFIQWHQSVRGHHLEDLDRQLSLSLYLIARHATEVDPTLVSLPCRWYRVCAMPASYQYDAHKRVSLVLAHLGGCHGMRQAVLRKHSGCRRLPVQRQHQGRGQKRTQG